MSAGCRVYWGSHGCCLERGHYGRCECECARDERGVLLPKYDEDGVLHNVGAWPYYGPDTHFYGEDALALNDASPEPGPTRNLSAQDGEAEG